VGVGRNLEIMHHLRSLPALVKAPDGLALALSLLGSVCLTI